MTASSEQIARRGLTVAGMAILAFGVWGSVADLATGIHAKGVVDTGTGDVEITPLVAGTVDSLMVSEGDRVQKAQVLFQIDAYAIARSIASQEKTVYDLQLKLTLTQHLADSSFGTIRTHEGPLASFYQARADAHSNEIKTLQQQLEALDAQKSTQERVRRTLERQVAELNDNTERIDSLVRRSLVPHSRLVDALSDLTSTENQLANTISTLTTIKGEISTTHSRLAMSDLEWKKELMEEISDLESKIELAQSQLDILKRKEKDSLITAPVAGRVMAMRIRAEGQSTRAGEEIMTIVPDQTELIFKSRIPAVLGEKLSLGMPAKVRVGPDAMTPPIEAKVSAIGDNSLLDEFGQRYFPIEVSPLKQERWNPGVTADIMLTTGSETMLEYVTAPLARRIFHCCF